MMRQHLAATILLLGIGASAQPYLTSLVELDALRNDSIDSVIREGNVDIIPSSSEGDDIAICHLPYLVGFSSDREPSNTLGQYEGAWAIALAAQHLNTGNGSIVGEVEGLNDRCNIRFTLETIDTELRETVGVNQVIQVTDREPGKEHLPCAFLGAFRSAVSIPTSIISSLRGYPQISPISTSSALDDTSQYPLFGRTIPSDDGTAVPLVLYYRNVLGVKNLAVLHVNDSYGNAYARGVKLAAQTYTPDMNVATFDTPEDATLEATEKSIGFLKDTQYTYFFGILFPTDYDKILTEAYRQGIAGTGKHNWLFSDSAGTVTVGRSFERGSPLALAYKGTAVLSATGGYPGIANFDRLVTAMKALNNENDIAFVRSLLPTYTDGEDVDHGSVVDNEAFLETPGFVAPFLFDATIALGLAACSVTQDATYFDGKMMFDAMVRQSFEGASGTIVFNSMTGTRDPQSSLFSLVNTVDDEAESNDEFVQFKQVNTHVFRSGEWDELRPYFFNDGTSNVRPDLPEQQLESNYLTWGMKVVGYLLCAVVIVLSIVFAVWTCLHRKTAVIRASQAIFLYIICTGSLIMASTIVPLSIDLGSASQEGCNIACQTSPWLLASGFSLIFSALFTKIQRINKIFRSAQGFKRVKVTALDVAKPMASVMGGEPCVLL